MRWLFILGLLAQCALTDDLPTIHLIPHSHCDPGWLETYEAYYRNDVAAILSTAFTALRNDISKKFVWSEISFFHLWFDGLNDDDKTTFKEIVISGRWEFVGGGWVQNDEASPLLNDVIDQITVGHNYLFERFGVIPRFGWQIDPFGHSEVTPALFKLMGYDAMVINRIHFVYKAALKEHGNMEFLWKGTSMGGNDPIFTHVLHTHYSAPKGFDWEGWESSGTEQVRPDNVQRRSVDLVAQLKDRWGAYQSPNLLVTFGDDFKFKNAQLQFGNMDQIIQYINAHPETFKAKIQYSTLAEYFAAVASHKLLKYPLLEGDFFPYADNGDSFWTGYFTTRPFLKQISRTFGSVKRSAEILLAISRRKVSPSIVQHAFTLLEESRRDAALFLHHDGITGTARTHVVADYMHRMNRALVNGKEVTRTLITELFQGEKSVGKNQSFPVVDVPFDMGFELPPIVHPGVQPVIIFNSLSWRRTELICSPIGGSSVSVTDINGASIEAQVDPVWSQQSSNALDHPDAFRVCFAYQLPALSASVFFLDTNLKSFPSSTKISKTDVWSNEIFIDEQMASAGWALNQLKGDSSRPQLTIENAAFRLQLAPGTGMLESLVDLDSGNVHQLDQSYLHYRTTRSGAYLFRNQGPAEPIDTIANAPLTIRITRGNLMQSVNVFKGDAQFQFELVNSFSSAVNRRVYMHSKVVVGHNRELILRFKTNFNNSDGQFFVHNGVEFIARRNNPTVNIPGNYYPSVGGARIQEKGKRLTMLSGHAAGVASLSSGQLEFMLHRSLIQDDGRGLAQPVIDSTASVMSMRILFETTNRAMAESSHKRQSIGLDNPPVVLYPSALAPMSRTDWYHILGSGGFPLTGFPSTLSPGIHILSMMARDAFTDEVILRVMNLHNPNEEQSPTTMNFQHLCQGDVGSSVVTSIADVREVSLSAAFEFLDSPSNGSYPQFPATLLFGSSGKVFSTFNGGVDLEARDIVQGNQNAGEDGVFISDVAVRKANNGKEDPARRRMFNAVGFTEISEFPLLPGQLRSFILTFGADTEPNVESRRARRLKLKQSVMGLHPIELLPKKGEILFVIALCFGAAIGLYAMFQSTNDPIAFTRISDKEERHVV